MRTATRQSPRSPRQCKVGETDVINFIGLRRYFAAISLALLIPSFVALAVWQLNPGIDFQGGLEMEVRFLQGIEPATVETALTDAGFDELTVSETREETILVSAPVPADIAPAQFETNIADAITLALGEFQQPDSSTDETQAEIEIWFAADASQDDLRDALRSIDLADARVQGTGSASFKIRAQEPEGGSIELLRQGLEF